MSRCLEPSERGANFERLFRAFRATSLYPQAANSYDDIYYLYELRGGRESESAGPDLATRFQEHLRCVLDSLSL